MIRTIKALCFPEPGALKQGLFVSVEQPSTIADDMARTRDEIGDATGRSNLDLLLSPWRVALWLSLSANLLAVAAWLRARWPAAVQSAAAW